MKTLINKEEERIADEIYELAKILPNEIQRDFKIMLETASMLLNYGGEKTKESGIKGA